MINVDDYDNYQRKMMVILNCVSVDGDKAIAEEKTGGRFVRKANHNEIAIESKTGL